VVRAAFPSAARTFKTLAALKPLQESAVCPPPETRRREDDESKRTSRAI
jgi:hypothetical protein